MLYHIDEFKPESSVDYYVEHYLIKGKKPRRVELYDGKDAVKLIGAGPVTTKHGICFGSAKREIQLEHDANRPFNYMVVRCFTKEKNFPHDSLTEEERRRWLREPFRTATVRYPIRDLLNGVMKVDLEEETYAGFYLPYCQMRAIEDDPIMVRVYNLLRKRRVPIIMAYLISTAHTQNTAHHPFYWYGNVFKVSSSTVSASKIYGLYEYTIKEKWKEDINKLKTGKCTFIIDKITALGEKLNTHSHIKLPKLTQHYMAVHRAAFKAVKADDPSIFMKTLRRTVWRS